MIENMPSRYGSGVTMAGGSHSALPNHPQLQNLRTLSPRGARPDVDSADVRGRQRTWRSDRTFADIRPVRAHLHSGVLCAGLRRRIERKIPEVDSVVATSASRSFDASGVKAASMTNSFAVTLEPLTPRLNPALLSLMAMSPSTPNVADLVICIRAFFMPL